MFYQTFLSPQVKRCAIITYKYGMYELLHELLNDLRLDIRKLGNTRKLTKLHRMIAERPAPLQLCAIPHENPEYRRPTQNTWASPRCPVTHCSTRKISLTRKNLTYTKLLPQTHQKLTFWKTQTKYVNQTTATEIAIEL